MNKLFLPLIFVLLSISCVTADIDSNDLKVESSDGIITVVPMEDGLHIKKKHSSSFVHVTLKVYGPNGENYGISTNEKQNDFLYPFVTAGSTYKVFVQMMDASWGNWTESKAAIVTATGGLGDCYADCKSYYYDNDSMNIVMTDFVFEKPENIAILGNNLSGNIYYNQTPGTINWKDSVWSFYESNENKVDISTRRDFILNSSFFIQLESRFTYNNLSYTKTLISNEKDLFTDSHPVTNISISNGILVPPFNPGIQNYEIRGTDKPVIITPEYAQGVKASKKILGVAPEDCEEDSLTVEYEGKEYTYNFKYVQGNVISFDGIEYLETFFDDFDGTELNTSKWRRCMEQERQGGMKGHGWWNKECIYLDGKGNLIIEAKRQENQNIAGAIDSQNLFEQSHGYYEIKFKCEKTSGLWYAFWLMGDNDSKHVGKGATDAAEIDVFELVPNEPYNGPNYFKTTLHWDGYGTAHKAKGSPAYNPDDDFYDSWHVAKFIWGENSYKLWLDEQKLWELDASQIDEEHFGGMCNGINHMIISSEFGDWGGAIDDKLLPAKMYVDYVKVGF